ncbi:MAG: DUF2199 domain-containing protein [Pyrinomonadaceae bacterium]
MGNEIQCETHGECEETFVCSHLVGGAAGLGFNRDEPSEEDAFPDVWCDDCELIRAACDGWNEESEKLVEFLCSCSGCYERARIRNTHTAVKLDDLAEMRWKCGSCEEWHTGACLDFSYDSPYYWTHEHEKASGGDAALAGSSEEQPATFLGEDFCAIEDQDFFVRGNIHLPIIGSADTFRWGVWGSLSRENFETLLRMVDDAKRVELPPMFSWLSTQIDGYPDTLSLKMYAHIQEPDWRPTFELERTDHPLSQEYHNGITAERVKEIMMSRLPGNE